MTVWDFLSQILKAGIPWIIVILLVATIIWLVAHPNVVKEWNVNFSTWYAKYNPKKRKKVFEKRIDLTVGAARDKLAESLPQFMKRFLPYGLQIEWVDGEEDISSVISDSQIIVYVSSYKDEIKQSIGVLHNYCTKGFVPKAKIYMSSRTKDATDLVVTGKLAQSAGPHVYDYFNREYVPEIEKKNKNFAVAYKNLKKIDIDGLFIPVYMNEIDKYANDIYPVDPSQETSDTITDFGNFILNIVEKQPNEEVDLIFNKNGIKIMIVLAISDSGDINKHILSIENHIKKQDINTIYVLATGSKIKYATEIANQVYERNPQEVYEPIVSNYTRYTRKRFGNNAICFEINLRFMK